LPTDAEARQHQWWIDPREYARHEARRGRRFAFVNLVPARTALVVIDMVPFFVSGNPYCRGIVPNIGGIADSLRAAGGTVVWVLPALVRTPMLDEFLGPETAEAFRASGGTGPLAERLWSELVIRPGDVLVEKSAHSAFFPGRCALPGLLAEREVDTVLISGTVTNVCCESSARDAATLGLRVILVADANAARCDQDHNAMLHTIYRSFGDVRPTSDLLNMVQAPDVTRTVARDQ